MRRPGAGPSRRSGFRGIGGGADPTLLALASGTFARASTAWRANSDDTAVTSFGSGVLRQYVDGDRYSVLEGASTNHCTDDPTDITTGGGWAEVDNSGSFTQDADAGTAPDGTSNATRLTFGASANDRMQADCSAFTGLNVYRVSVWARTESGTKNFRLVYNDGVVQTSADQLATTTWQRFSVQFTAQAVPTTAAVWVRNSSAGNAGAILAWGMTVQDDAPHLLPSPILTASTTRAADSLTFPVSGLPAGITDASGFWFRLRPHFSNAQHVSHAAAQHVIDFTTASRLLRFNSAAATLSVLGDGGTVTSAAKTWSARQTLTIAVDWANAEIRFGGFTTGNETLDIAAAGDWSDVATTMRVGAAVGGATPMFSEITDFYPLSSSPI